MIYSRDPASVDTPSYRKYQSYCCREEALQRRLEEEMDIVAEKEQFDALVAHRKMEMRKHIAKWLSGSQGSNYRKAAAQTYDLCQQKLGPKGWRAIQALIRCAKAETRHSEPAAGDNQTMRERKR